MTIDLTDADRAAIQAALESGEWNHPFLKADVEKVYRAGLAAGRARAIEECAQRIENGRFLHDDAPTARFAKECAAAIRALLNGK